MRFIHLLFLLLLTLSRESFAQEQRELKLLHLTGPVYSVRTEKVSAKVEGVGNLTATAEKREFISNHTFDQLGNLIAHQYPGEVVTRLLEMQWQHQFDQQNRIISSKITTGEPGKSPASTFTEVYAYDEKGRKTITKNQSSTGLEYSRTTYLYDQTGRLIEKRITRSDSTKLYVGPCSRIQYFYDDAQRLKSKHCFNAQDQFTQRETYRENERPGLEWPYELFDKQDQLLIRWDYRYDDRGRPVELYHYGRGGVRIKHSKMSYEDDARGNWIKLKIVREVSENDTTKTEYETQLRTIKYY